MSKQYFNKHITTLNTDSVKMKPMPAYMLQQSIRNKMTLETLDDKTYDNLFDLMLSAMQRGAVIDVPAFNNYCEALSEEYQVDSEVIHKIGIKAVEKFFELDKLNEEVAAI